MIRRAKYFNIFNLLYYSINLMLYILKYWLVLLVRMTIKKVTSFWPSFKDIWKKEKQEISKIIDRKLKLTQKNFLILTLS